MVREIVDVAIKQHKPLEITYSKDGVSTKVFNLKDVTYSQQYGNIFICGYCEKYKSELTFSIDKITHANVDWIEILGNDTCAMQDGLYVFVCRSDMHLEFELRNYKMGDRLQDHYQNEDGISSCYSSIDVLAYHFIPFFSKEGQREWTPFEPNNEERKCGFYTFAYIKADKETQREDEYDWAGDYDNWMNTWEFPSPWELTNTKGNGIFYTVNVLGIPFNKLRIPNNIIVIAYNYCTDYREREHSNHWKLVDELGEL